MNSSKMNPFSYIVLLSCFFLSGCFASYKLGSYYHPRDKVHGLGFSDTRLGPDLWRVTYRGYYIPESQAYDYAILRSAELTKANGFNYFSVENERAVSTNQAGIGMITGGMNLAVGGTVMGGYPESILLVRGKNSKESQGDAHIYDAEFISREIKHKYQISVAN